MKQQSFRRAEIFVAATVAVGAALGAASVLWTALPSIPNDLQSFVMGATLGSVIVASIVVANLIRRRKEIKP